MIPVEEGEVEKNPSVARQLSLLKENPRRVEMHQAGSQEQSTDMSGHLMGRRERVPEIVERRELQEGLVRMAATKSKRVV